MLKLFKLIFPKKVAFTLVELIIVITVVAILATVGFLSFSDYGARARDSVRKSDLESIIKALDLYIIKKGKYISPGNSQESTEFEGWIDGYITEEVGGKLNFSKTPTDPLGYKAESKYYKYSVSEQLDSYKLEVNYELEGKVVVGNVTTSCENIFKNNQFKGNGVYKAYSSNYKPINIYCHENYPKKTFYEEIVGGDIEREDLIKITTSSSNLSISSEENATQNGEKSIKAVSGLSFGFNEFTYVDSSKTYKIFGKFKNIRDANPGRVFFGFTEFDKDFNFISPDYVNIIEGTNTYLTRSTPENSKKIYFWCDDNYFNNLKSKYDHDTVVAYNIEDNLSDLPNKNVSETIGDRANINTRDVSGFLEKVGFNECSMRTIKTFRQASENDKIRFHKKIGYHNYSGAEYKEIQSGEWVELSGVVSGLSEYGVKPGKFRRGTTFIKPFFSVNKWNHYEGNNFSEDNPNSITYIDDIRLEIVN